MPRSRSPSPRREAPRKSRSRSPRRSRSRSRSRGRGNGKLRGTAGRWNSVRLMLAAMNILYYSLFGGDMDASEWSRIMERHLLSDEEVQLLRTYRGFKPFLAACWALEEAQVRPRGGRGRATHPRRNPPPPEERRHRTNRQGNPHGQRTRRDVGRSLGKTWTKEKFSVIEEKKRKKMSAALPQPAGAPPTPPQCYRGQSSTDWLIGPLRRAGKAQLRQSK